MLIFIISLLALQSSSLIHEVSVGKPMVFASYRSLTGMAMYSPGDAPTSGPPGNGRASIKTELTFYRDRVSKEASLEVLVIPDKDMMHVGTYLDGTNYFCCTHDIFKRANGCRENHELGKLIIQPALNAKGFDDDSFQMVQFDTDETSKTVEWSHEVKQTGLNIYVVAVCDPYLGEVTFEGTTTWMNPYGHLPGELYGFLPFYGWMSIIYTIAAIFWISMNCLYWNEILSIHNYISVVLIMCLLEMVTWYADYASLNTAGIRYKLPFVLGMMTSVTRRTIARMLVCVVSMGQGIVKPSLEPAVKKKVGLLGFVYWLFAFAFEVFIHYHETNEVAPMLRLVLTPPVAILDGIFWWWIFISLHQTVIDLTQGGQTSKLSLYRQFAITLGLALVVALLFACYQLYYIWGSLYLEQWAFMWVMEVGFWQVLYTSVFFIIMVLWRPHEHSKQIAFMTQIPKDELDIEDFEDDFARDTMDG